MTYEEFAHYLQLQGHNVYKKEKGVNFLAFLQRVNTQLIDYEELEAKAYDLGYVFSSEHGWVDKEHFLFLLEKRVEANGYKNVQFAGSNIAGYRFIGEDTACDEGYRDYFFFDPHGEFIRKEEAVNELII